MLTNTLLILKSNKPGNSIRCSGARVLLLMSTAVLWQACKPVVADEKGRVEHRAVVILQPLEYHDQVALRYLKEEIASFYNVTVHIAANKSSPEHAFYKPGNRYRADKMIAWLKSSCPDSVRTVVGITQHDISSTKNEQYDYGIMGLGYKPGRSCIVSSYRPAKTAKSKQHLQERVLKLVLHEMGHNFGLSHCPHETCIMVDAEGKMKLDQEKGLCHECRKKLRN